MGDVMMEGSLGTDKHIGCLEDGSLAQKKSKEQGCGGAEAMQDAAEEFR